MLCKKKKNIGVFLTTSFIAGMVTVQSTNVNAASQSIAQNKGYSASSNQGINKFGLAFDGNMGSRWESQQGVDPQWIEADLGAEYVITGAELKWETAAGKDYEIQVSSDGTHWDSVYTKVGGNGGDEVITFSVTKTGRYVRMFGTSRTTTYGYSLYEFEIYGTPVTNTLEKPLITPDGGIYTSDQLVNIAAGYPNAVIRYTLDGSEPTISNGIKYMGPFTIFDTTTVKALAYYGSVASPVTSTIIEVNNASNIALNKNSEAKSENGAQKSNLAFDGKTNTRWESEQGVDDEWILVDLGKKYSVSGVKLIWEAAYGKKYKIQVSEDKNTWQDAYDQASGSGGTENLTFPTPMEGRYVKMYGIQRATQWGYSLYEFEVYGTAVVNREDLQTSINNTKILRGSKVVGSANGNVPQSAVDDLQAAIDVAQNVYSNPAATQIQIDTQAIILSGACADFNNSVIVINKAGLMTAINDAKALKNSKTVGTGDGNVPQSAVDNLQVAIGAAENVYNDALATQIQIDAQITALSGASGNFNNSVIVINKTGLMSLINDTKALKNSKTVGTGNGNVPQSAVDDLQVAIGAAENVYNDALATQSQIDAQITALSGASGNFNNSVIVINKTGLMTAINDTKALKNSKTVGTGNGNVPKSAVDDLQAAIDAAENVYNDALATQSQIDAQITALSGASGNFNNSVIVSNKIGLMTAINDAKALKNSKTVGTGDGNVPQSAVDDLQAAIDAAENVYNDASATQSQIDAQITALSGASGNFNNSVIVINKTGLMTVINDAKALKNSKTVGTGNGNVPQSAVDDLQVAIDAAENVYNDASATQSQIDAQITASSGACSDFNNSVIGIIVHKNELNIAINDAKALKNSKTVGTGNGNVPQSAVDDLQVAIDAAENVYNNASATQSQIDAQITALSGARSDFNNSVIGIIVHKSELNIAINDARVLKNSKTVGNGNVPQNAVDDLQTIIDAAENVYNDSAATQSDVEEQRVKLAEASNDFNNSIIGISVDKIGLMTAINNAKTLRHSKTMGNAEGNIPKSAVDNLQTVIDAAENVYNNIGATQSDIEAQVKNLSAACNNFNNAVIKKRDSGSGSSSKSSIKAERRHLKTLLEQAVDLLTSKKSIVLNKEFKVEVDKLEEAINNARTVYNSTSSVIKDIKRQRNRLQEAIDDFNMAILKENDVQVPTEIDNIKQGTVIDNFKDLINKVISIIKSSGVKNVDSLMEIKTRNEIGAFTGTTATTTDLPKISDIKEQKEQKEQIEEDRVVKKDISESENSEETDGLNNQKTTQIEKTEDDKNIFIKKAGIVAAISIVSISSGFSIYKFRIKK